MWGTGINSAPFDPPCTVEAGGLIFPMIAADGRSLVVICGADGFLVAQYYLASDGVYHLFIPGELAPKAITSGSQP